MVDRRNSSSASIFRAPARYRQLKLGAFDPMAVSFGPYHHEDRGQPLQTEKIKKKVLRLYLQHAGKDDISDLVVAVMENASELKKCYAELEKPWKKDEVFAGLMVRDALFMLAILDVCARTVGQDRDAKSVDAVGGAAADGYNPRYYGRPIITGNGLEFSPDDPVFGKKAREHTWPHIRRDMLLVENQIPLKVLEILLRTPFCWQKTSCSIEQHLHKLVLQFFDGELDEKTHAPAVDGPLCHHVLDLYRKNRFMPRGRHHLQDEITIDTKKTLTLTSIKQRKKSTADRFQVELERKWGKTIIHIPQVNLDDMMESMFLNLLALEHLQSDSGNEVTKFIQCMAKLVPTPAKCKALREGYNVTLSRAWTDAKVSNFFRWVTSGFSIPVDWTSESSSWTTSFSFRTLAGIILFIGFRQLYSPVQINYFFHI